MSAEKKNVRRKFRSTVFSRDKHKCRKCGEAKFRLNYCLDAHHITDRNEMPNGGYVPENGIALCPRCHIKAEKYHATGGQEHVEGFHPDDLYALIKSSKELATKKSLTL